MASPTHCPVCGTELPKGIPAGLCPVCLFRNTVNVSGLLQDESPPANEPRDFGDYELVTEIARGGMGVVYKARQKSLDRLVAVKMLLFGSQANPEFIKRFRIEASAAAALQHPNIVAIHEVGVHQDEHFLVMDYVAGANLATLVKQQPLSPKRAARYVRAVAGAIHFAHERGILHRDLKPSNVLIDENDQPRVTDFGLAKRLGNESQPSTDLTQLTLSGHVLGSPGYMPPEQAVGARGRMSRRSDVYALGATLYHLLTGRPPFGGGSVAEILHQVETQDPASPRLLNAGVPSDLETICLKCLEKEPEQRYGSAQELADELGRFLDDESIQARPVGGPERMWRWCRRRPVIAGLLIALNVAIAAGLLGILWQWRRAELESKNAVSSAEIAKRQQRIASEQETLAHRHFYAAQINLAYHAFQAGEVARTMDLIETLRPIAGQEDYRTFEWFHLWGLCHSNALASLRGHKSPIHSVAFSADGAILASSGADGTIRLWDSTDRRETKRLEPASDYIAYSVTFAPDGKTLASSHWRDAILIWEIPGGKVRYAFSGHTDAVRSMAISPDGKVLASGSTFEVKLWDLQTGTERATLKGNHGPVLGIGFSPDGKWLASGDGWSSDGNKNVVLLWDMGSDMTGPSLSLPTKATSLAISGDGRTLATAAFHTIELWDIKTGNRLGVLKGHTAEVSSLTFAPDGVTLFSGSQDRTVRRWRLPPDLGARLGHFADHSVTLSATNSELLGVHLDSITSVAVSPDGTMLASGGNDGVVKLWRAAHQPASLGSIASSAFRFDESKRGWPGMSHLLIAADGQTLYMTSTEFGTRYREIETGVQSAELPNAKGRRAAMSPDGRLLAVGASDGTIGLWDLATGVRLSTVQAHGKGPTGLGVNAIAFSPDGRTLATGGFEGGEVRLWDVGASLKFLKDIPMPAGITGLAFSPDRKALAIVTRFHVTYLFNLTTGRMNRILRQGTGLVGLSAMALSQNGQWLAVCGANGVVIIWNVENGLVLSTLKGHTSPVDSVAFSPDGRTIATGSEDQSVRLWDPVTGQERLAFTRHRRSVLTLAFSPDGNSLFTGDEGGVVNWLRAIHDLDSIAVMQPRATPLGAMKASDYNSLAWRIVMESKNSNEIAQAVAMAERANELKTNQAIYLNTLGVAYYRAGHFRKAIETLLLAGQASTNGFTAYDLFVLAMANQHLGNLAQAQRFYKQGVDWAERRRPTSEPLEKDLASLWIEVAQMLGQSPPTNVPTDKPSPPGPVPVIDGEPNPEFWLSKARLMTKAKRYDEALHAYTAIINPPNATTNGNDFREAGSGRARVLQCLGRWTEARSAYEQAYPFPIRPPKAGPNQIDLWAYFNHGLTHERHGFTNYHLRGLPTGLHELEGVTFDVRGIVELAGLQARERGFMFPEQVVGINLSRTANRLSFLHAAAWPSTNGTLIGFYRIRYADGQQEKIPMIYGLDVLDWIGDPLPISGGLGPQVAWHHGKMRLFKSTWVNPRPGVVINRLDFVSTMTDSAPFLIAITAE